MEEKKATTSGERMGCLVAGSFFAGVALTGLLCYLGVAGRGPVAGVEETPPVTEERVFEIVEDVVKHHPHHHLPSKHVQWFPGLVTYTPDGKTVTYIQAQLGYDQVTGDLVARKIVPKKPEGEDGKQEEGDAGEATPVVEAPAAGVEATPVEGGETSGE